MSHFEKQPVSSDYRRRGLRYWRSEIRTDGILVTFNMGFITYWLRRLIHGVRKEEK